MSNVQNNTAEVKGLLRKTITLGSFVIFPLTFGFMAVADSAVVLLLTEKWAGCIPFVQIMCVSYSLRIISTSCAQSIKAIGRSDVYMKSILVYKILETVSIIITAFISVKAIAIGTVVNALIIVVIQFYCTNRYVDYSLSELVQDMLPVILLTAVMAFPVWLLGSFGSSVGVLIIRILLGAMIYVGGAFLTRSAAMRDLMKLVKR